MTERPLSGRKDTGPKAVLPVTSFMVDSLISTFEMSKDGLTGLALGIGGKAVATATFASDTTDSKGGKAASFAASEVMQTLNLLRLANQASPNMIIATLGATFIRKTAAAFMLGGDDNRQAELIGDWAGSTDISVFFERQSPQRIAVQSWTGARGRNETCRHRPLPPPSVLWGNVRRLVGCIYR